MEKTNYSIQVTDKNVIVTFKKDGQLCSVFCDKKLPQTKNLVKFLKNLFEQV